MAEVHVSTWTELHDALNNKSGVTVYLDNDIDCNDDQPEGITLNITLNSGCHVYGNNHAIRNIRISGGQDYVFKSNISSGSVGFYNVNFENILIDSSNDKGFLDPYKGSSTNYIYFYNCRFSGEIIRGVLISISEDRWGNKNCVFMSQCSLKFKLGDKGYLSTVVDRGAYSPNFSDCVINIISGVRPIKATFKGTKLKGVYSTITLNNDSTTASSPFFLNAESVIDADVSGDVTLYNSNTSTYPVTAVLVNSDRVAGTIASGLLQATTAQMTDAAYLDSIGFPIGVD